MYRGSLSSRRLILPSFSVRKSTASSVQGVFDRQNRNDRNVGKSSERDSVKGSAENTFAASSRGSFFQEAPRLRNQYSGDLFLQSYLRRILPTEVLQEIRPDLEKFGHRVATDIDSMGRQCELQPPRLEHFDAWGRRVDNIHTCQGWRQLHDVSAEEGLISIAFERKYGQWSRIYQAVKLFMFSPSSGLYSCPLAMTDGAAKTIEVLS